MNINTMMQQAKKMQAKLEKSQKELELKEFIVEKQGIKLILFGSRKIKSIEIDKMLVDPNDKEILEDMIIITMNEANQIIDNELAKIQPSNANIPL